EERAGGLLARKDEERHVELGGGERRKVLCVLLESPEVLEASPHAVLTRVGRGVESAIGLRHRLGLIRGEVVPEMLEVDAFPPLDQRKGCVAIEVEVPEVAQ